MRGASTQGTRLTGAHLHGIELGEEDLSGAEAQWVDHSAAADGSERGGLRPEPLAESSVPADRTRRFFGMGDVLRNAELEFHDGALVQIESRFEHCNIRLGDDAELVVGEHGVLKDCTITGGRLRVLGRFLEQRSPGLLGPRELHVSKEGAVVATVQQPEQATQFAFERGCQLRVQITEPSAGAAQR